jgi:hypothetical protein
MVEKSPFLVFQQFLSPLLCEQIIDDLEAYEPDVDVEGTPVKSVCRNDKYEMLMFEKMQEIIPVVETHYNIKYKGTESVSFEWLPQDSVSTPVSENSSYLRKQWLRTRERDLTGIIFLCDYQETVPFDSLYEVYGGKLEFPQHQFGFNAQRGTLVVFPSDPHFINVNSKIMYGDLFQARIQITATKPFIYQPTDFPGDYTSWFREFV